jgi:methylated-DNA-protein-cysteine methyltransferase related protein
MKTDFFAKVYDIVAQIPPGYVLTYGQIAAMAGNPRAARIVGYAMNSAPADRDLPCHRVVNRTGSMAPGYVFGGQDCQRQRLEEEGVTFDENGCINMKKHLWWQ